jgi:tetratricopeptide (TPR) repeat protein
LRAFDEAEAFASRAYKRAPHNPLVAEGWAKVAQERGDLAEALRRWTAVWKRHRNHPPAYIGRASCLTGLDRFQEAEACISEGVKFFPQNLLCRIEHARVAECRKDWPAALIRWESVFEHHRHVSGEVGVARALLELDRFEEAEERLEAAMVRHPVAVEIPIGLANVASRRGDKRECAERWALVRARFPMIPFGYRGGVQVLKELGEFDEAAMVAREAIARFPQDAWALSLMKDLGPVSKIT